MDALTVDRRFKYIGPPQLTRGDYGDNVVGGHTYEEDDPAVIYTFDADYGDIAMCLADEAEANGFVEIT